ncbi:glutathione S-transferase [Lacimicrobium sp. SS2-24]|uniref:glutathione S-transferase n=1 Tax=Lacimicrobium sp. SS2-24 TaxID=2005569 RepID=UPI000B4B7362|nr:glutathione S-transferase [Lacimicrobium sp. SS2-24]
MLTLHHLNNSRSQRILWLLEELGLDYQIQRYERDSKTMLAPQSLKNVHPLGKSPVLTDKDRVLAESGAIIHYLCSEYGGQDWIPAQESEQHLDYHYWLHFAEGSLMPPMLLKLVMDKVRTSPMPFFARPIARKIADKAMKSFIGPNLKNNFSYVEQQLQGKEWLAGSHPTGADIQMSFPLEAAVARGIVGESHPNICAYVARIHAREAYQKALKAGGDYAYA